MEIINGVPGVWIVRNKIITPPPRWAQDVHGSRVSEIPDQISYQLHHSCNSQCRDADEDDLRLTSTGREAPSFPIGNDVDFGTSME